MEPYDEDKIETDDRLIRRINPSQHLIRDDNLGCSRVSTKAFSPSSEENGGMSIDIEALIISDGQDPKRFVTTPTFTGSVVFTAGAARDLGLLVGYHEVPDNKYHGEVWGSNRPNRFSKRQRNGLLASSEWYVELDGVLLNK